MKLISSNGYEYQIDECHSHLVEGKSWCVAKAHKGKYKYVVNVVLKRGKAKTIYLHRLIALAKPGELVDHRNGDTLDNRSENLRLTTNRLNQGNQRRVRGKVELKGVTLERGKYRARIRCGGKKLSLGNYATKEEAAKAYAIAAKSVFGEYGYSNFQP